MDPAFSIFHRQIESPAPLFLHRSGGTVLIGDVDNGEVVLARGWRLRDRLSDIRRWRFATIAEFTQQVYYLVEEATGDSRIASLAAGEASVWAGSVAAIEP